MRAAQLNSVQRGNMASQYANVAGFVNGYRVRVEAPQGGIVEYDVELENFIHHITYGMERIGSKSARFTLNDDSIVTIRKIKQ